MKGTIDDPKALIREAYAIEGITAGECRTVFLDWALGTGTDDPRDVIARLLAHYGPSAPDHPMTAVLNEAMAQAEAPRRRGGWRSRPRGPVAGDG